MRVGYCSRIRALVGLRRSRDLCRAVRGIRRGPGGRQGRVLANNEIFTRYSAVPLTVRARTGRCLGTTGATSPTHARRCRSRDRNPPAHTSGVAPSTDAPDPTAGPPRQAPSSREAAVQPTVALRETCARRLGLRAGLRSHKRRPAREHRAPPGRQLDARTDAASGTPARACRASSRTARKIHDGLCVSWSCRRRGICVGTSG